ncbi:ribosome small subunit-dependent GTPase A [uncultured Abyssibacter sp.]|uniref:ribosome small subunit-dependent GTPase A n=1 Tax=uncultured Abyssibacter sp. TaxID=2320202 RepID=UPI0032B17ABC
MTDAATRLAELGWTAFEEAQGKPDHEPVRVFSIHRSEALARSVDGECRVDLAMHRALGAIAVGDWLLRSTDGDSYTRLERRTEIARKAAGEHVHKQVLSANVDRLLIVSSCNQEFSLPRLERYLVLACDCGVEPEIILTKADLSDEAESLARAAASLLDGVPVRLVDARDADQVRPLAESIRPGETLALVGSSGVGKTTLANALGAPDLATGAVRGIDDKGRHTTTARSMVQLPGGGLLIDNPGIRELQLTDCERGIAKVFSDVLGRAEQCRFQDCSHEAEPGCAVQAAIESGALPARRLDSFRALEAEQARNAEILEAKRQRARDIGHKYRKLNWSKRARRGQ